MEKLVSSVLSERVQIDPMTSIGMMLMRAMRSGEGSRVEPATCRAGKDDSEKASKLAAQSRKGLATAIGNSRRVGKNEVGQTNINSADIGVVLDKYIDSALAAHTVDYSQR